MKKRKGPNEDDEMLVTWGWYIFFDKLVILFQKLNLSNLGVLLVVLVKIIVDKKKYLFIKRITDFLFRKGHGDRKFQLVPKY